MPDYQICMLLNCLTIVISYIKYRVIKLGRTSYVTSHFSIPSSFVTHRHKMSDPLTTVALCHLWTASESLCIGLLASFRLSDLLFLCGSLCLILCLTLSLSLSLLISIIVSLTR